MCNRAKERIPVSFDCTVALGEMRRKCLIQNISHGGVLTLWQDEHFHEIPFRIGDRFPLEIRLSDHKQFGEKGLSCVGTVVRVAIERRQVAFRISRARLGVIGKSAFGAADPRSTYVM
jgi:hypothetical protein